MQQSGEVSVTGRTLVEAQFDPGIIPYSRWIGSFWLVVSVVGILLIPFWLLFCLWYSPEYMRRLSARLTTGAVEIRKGVFFRKESTIPLNRITDVRLHDDPLMRMCGIRGLRVETAGQSGQSASSEGDLVGIVDPVAFRDSILRQRQATLTGEEPAVAPQRVEGTDQVLTEIRDILARIEQQGRGV